jgi:hypothetical protein
MFRTVGWNAVCSWLGAKPCRHQRLARQRGQVPARIARPFTPTKTRHQIPSPTPRRSWAMRGNVSPLGDASIPITATCAIKKKQDSSFFEKKEAKKLYFF